MKTSFLLTASLLSFSLMFSSCTREVKTSGEERDYPKAQQQLVNWDKMNDFEWRNQSFPLWFNPQLIDSLNIESIQLDFLSYNIQDTLIEFGDTLPYREKRFFFKENGDIKELLNTEYNAAIKISQTKFSYSSPLNDFGYSLPIISNTISFGEDRFRNQLNRIEDLQLFRRLSFQAGDDEYLHFIDENEENKMSHYFIIDSTKWSVTYLDQKFKPEGEEVFYFGSPLRYNAAFSLTNLVEKTMFIEQERYPNEVIQSQVFYKRDFKTIRHFKYNEEGVCVGFTDSLKTITNDFLHLEIGIIDYKNKIPAQILFYNEEDIEFEFPIKKVRFSYTFSTEL